MYHKKFADRLNEWMSDPEVRSVDTNRFHDVRNKSVETASDLEERLGALFELVIPIFDIFREFHVPYAVTRHIAIVLRQLEAHQEGFSRILDTDNLNDIDIIIPFEPTLIARLNAALSRVVGINVDRPISTDAEAEDWHEHGFTSRSMGRFKINGVTVEILADFGYIDYPGQRVLERVRRLFAPQEFFEKYYRECVSLDLSGKIKELPGLSNHILSTRLSTSGFSGEIPIILGEGLAATYQRQKTLLQEHEQLSLEDEQRLGLIDACVQYSRRALQAVQGLLPLRD